MRHTAAALALLLSVCAVHAENPLQPPIYRSHKVNDAGNVKQMPIIGGLLKRQNSCDPGYGYCSNNGRCCQLGGDCCSTGGCCAPGSYCTAPRHCCYNNQSVCESTGCCYSYEQCCRDAGCCPSGSYCIVGSDGKIGCCPTGTTCSGPIGSSGSSGGNSGGSSGSNNSSPPPTSISTTSSSSTSTSPTSTRTPAVVPSADPGFRNVMITADNSQITWSAGGWTVGNATCDPTQVSKKTNKINQWLTFFTPANASAEIYLDISWNSASFNIFIDGLQSDVNLGSLTNCQYHQIGPIYTGSPHNITIYVYGQLMSGRQTGSSSSSWSFEFNSFVFGEQSATTSSLGSGSSVSNSANRMGPGCITAAAGVLLSAIVTFLV